MEINSENKSKFFAHYIGQRLSSEFYSPIMRGVVQEGKTNADWKVKTQHLSLPIEDIHLPLKPLSSISDEDAYYVGASVNCWSWAERKEDFFKDDEMKDNHIAYGKMFTSSIGKEYGPGMSHPFAHNSTDILHGFDFLRLKGYALPWMGLSVEDMVSAGWIKLK